MALRRYSEDRRSGANASSASGDIAVMNGLKLELFGKTNWSSRGCWVGGFALCSFRLSGFGLCALRDVHLAAVSACSCNRHGSAFGDRTTDYSTLAHRRSFCGNDCGTRRLPHGCRTGLVGRAYVLYGIRARHELNVGRGPFVYRWGI